MGRPRTGQAASAIVELPWPAVIFICSDVGRSATAVHQRSWTDECGPFRSAVRRLQRTHKQKTHHAQIASQAASVDGPWQSAINRTAAAMRPSAPFTNPAGSVQTDAVHSKGPTIKVRLQRSNVQKSSCPMCLLITRSGLSRVRWKITQKIKDIPNDM
ncbi:hypothetical protein ACLOJK_022944 [Asimina triloba]